MKLEKLTIRGFKSIKELNNFELRNINILIGDNGTGKSNFIEFLRMLNEMMKGNLQQFIAKNGGADGFLFNSPSVTQQIHSELKFGDYGYRFTLEPTVNENFIFANEEQAFLDQWKFPQKGHSESQLSDDNISLRDFIDSWRIYHFHDTSHTAAARRSEIVEDNEVLRSNGSNIAPCLLFLRENNNDVYRTIVDNIRLVAPFFDDFILKPYKNGELSNRVKLDWKQKGSDYPMQPYHLSDGTLRFICLATLLLMQIDSEVIVLDEPELGLHPFAISVLAGLIQYISTFSQIIVSTQSTTLLNHFEPSDAIVVERKNGGESTFTRLEDSRLEEWLEDYTLGDLFEKNVLAKVAHDIQNLCNC
ncbi:MAG: AAA family ATPase [Planctomycetaceae bacterium]|jgi:predicted ATPase|nr:AAA family ATPase [Planctomycetaceae bacterium]